MKYEQMVQFAQGCADDFYSRRPMYRTKAQLVDDVYQTIKKVLESSKKDKTE